MEELFTRYTTESIFATLFIAFFTALKQKWLVMGWTYSDLKEENGKLWQVVLTSKDILAKAVETIQEKQK